jgi:hypothetical protein
MGWAGFASLPLAAQEHWRLTEEVRIGSVDEGPASFGDIRGIATNAKGWIFVLDFSTQDVRVFDAQGRHLKTVGRKGSGPGEFQNANGIARAPNGTLWLNDPANARFTALDGDGGYQSSFTVPATGYGFLWVGGVDPAGRLFDEIYVRNEQGYRTALRRFSADRQRVDTLSVPDCSDPARSAPQLYVIKSNNMEAHITVPFTAGPVTAIDPAGYALVRHERPLPDHQDRARPRRASRRGTARSGAAARDGGGPGRSAGSKPGAVPWRCV